MANLEGENIRLFKAVEGRARSTAPLLFNRIEVLQVLATALMKEIQDLGQAHTTEIGQVNLADEVRRFESHVIHSALVQTGGRQRRAARLLGMKVTTLNSKIKRYDIDTSEMLAKSKESVSAKQRPKLLA